MFARSLANLAKTRGLLAKRNFSVSSVRTQETRNHKPDTWERRFLVWTGKYKSIAEVPDHVSHNEMERCRNRIRIRLANIMMGLTFIGCITMVVSGKAAAKRGETVSKQNLDWHKAYNESQEAKKE